MTTSTELEIVKLWNELRAEKVASKLAFSSVLMPENIPKVNWSGSVSLTGGTSEAVARFRVRFTRDDGRNDAPFVDFAQSVTFSPSYPSYSESQGTRVTGNDVNYVDDQNYRCYIAGTGSGYVDYHIDLTQTLAANYMALSSIAVAIAVEAISTVNGNLTITRVF